ncbi:MAG: c-type cytochrome biogenesis protein CcmF [Methylocystaceae bacterium]|nr:MAG: c-type cytochrome biogenesis protein CcmF [Methylocystaceae bacterium]
MSGRLIELGMSASALALILAILSVVLSVAGGLERRPSFILAARQALLANLALVTLACFTVVWSFVRNDFSVAYVAQNSNTRLPLVYRLTALWGAHEGSLLLWLWILTIYTAAAIVIHWRTHPRSMPYVIATLGAIQVGFLALILFLSSPFTELLPAPLEGRELNPLLQDPGLIIHPPMLYLGYVGFVVPFAFAISALVRGDAGAGWAPAMRRWTLFAWLALTNGIMLGGYWAYYELGWGGYWGWDPVENASLMPWLTGTALLHSVMAQEKRNLFRGWNVFLAIATFSLSLLGTFLVRSGVLTSVHSFAVDPARGLYLLAFLSIVVVGGFGFLIMRVDVLRSNARLEGSLSREAALLFNNLFLIVAAATVFVGTLYPLAAEVLSGEKITVAAPYFNKVVPPILVATVMLMALGPVIPWRKASRSEIERLLIAPGATAMAFAAVGYGFGVRGPVPLAAVAAMGLVLACVAIDVTRSVRARVSVTRQSPLSGLASLASWNRRRYGGLIVHVGVVIISFGVLASGLFQETKTIVVAPGDRFEIGGYMLEFQNMTPVEGPNWTARQADIAVWAGSESIGVLQPQRRNYPRGRTTTTESAIHSTLSGDLYLVVGEEFDGGRAAIRAYHIPFVGWIWGGWLIVISGSVFALSQRRRQTDAVSSPVPEAAATP